MMKTHRRSRLRMLGGAAAVTLLAGAGFALGSPGFAAEQAAAAPKQDEARPREERVIIRTHRIGEGEHKGHAVDARHSDHGGHERRVIVRTHRAEGEGDHAGHAGHGAHAGHGERPVRRFDVHVPHGGPGGPGVHLTTAVCGDGERSEVNEGDERTRVIVCSRGTASPAERIERMQRVRDRLAEDGELSAEQRARVTAALYREIARLRGR